MHGLVCRPSPLQSIHFLYFSTVLPQVGHPLRKNTPKIPAKLFAELNNPAKNFDKEREREIEKGLSFPYLDEMLYYVP